MTLVSVVYTHTHTNSLNKHACIYVAECIFLPGFHLKSFRFLIDWSTNISAVCMVIFVSVESVWSKCDRAIVVVVFVMRKIQDTNSPPHSISRQEKPIRITIFTSYISHLHFVISFQSTHPTATTTTTERALIWICKRGKMCASLAERHLCFTF